MQPTLLLIEDDPLSQDLIRSLCESRGFTVDAASDGFTGLKLLKDGAYAAALVDYHLPEMDGYALARLMRDLPRGSSAPLGLVGITADRFGLAARRGADALFDAVLPKPLIPGELFAILDRIADAAGLTPLRRAAEALTRAPDLDRARALAEALWRRHGLAGRPRALACPAPDAASRAALGHAFDVVDDPAEAELALLLDGTGVAELHAMRASGGGDAFLIPVADVSGACEAACDAAFRIGDAASWRAVADVMRRFAERREGLDADVRRAPDIDRRLLARLYVADRPLVLRRRATGERAPDDAAGFPGRLVLDATARLCRDGHLAREVRGEETVLTLTEGGVALLTGAPAAVSPASSAPAPVPPPAVEAPHPEQGPDQARAPGGAGILVIERQEALRESVRAALAGAGHAAHPASTLIEAMAVLEARPVDLVLLGDAVAGLDLLAVAPLFRTLRGADAPALPVVGLLAEATALPVDRLEAAGLRGSVGPDRSALLAAVERWRARPEPVEGAEAVVDETVQASVHALLGRELVEALIDRLLVQLDASFATEADAAALAHQAHATISSAGMLGFARLSCASRALEGAAVAGSPSRRTSPPCGAPARRCAERSARRGDSRERAEPPAGRSADGLRGGDQFVGRPPLGLRCL